MGNTTTKASTPDTPLPRSPSPCSICGKPTIPAVPDLHLQPCKHTPFHILCLTQHLYTGHDLKKGPIACPVCGESVKRVLIATEDGKPGTVIQLDEMVAVAVDIMESYVGFRYAKTDYKVKSEKEVEKCEGEMEELLKQDFAKTMKKHQGTGVVGKKGGLDTIPEEE